MRWFGHVQKSGSRKTRRAGYSLVEVSMALLVVGVGLLAVFGLFPEGLNAARRAVDDVETAAFADFVMNGLAVEAGLTNGNLSGPLLHSHSLVIEGQPAVRPAGGFTATTNFFWIPNWYGGGQDLGIAWHKTASFTYRLTVNNVPGGTGARYARLEVWPGEYPAGTTPPGRGRIFYREFLPVR